jgi:predicted dehydrogenase
MLKIAIIGCGKIADSHAEQIRRIKGCEIVAACDREVLMAQQFCTRYLIKAFYSDPIVMLAEAQPNVVHITTPPQSHFDLAKMALENGCHVYVEKPFTLYESDARTLINLAEASGLKITAGHDDQFTHVARELRRLVKEGFVGNRVVHMESYYCYELGNSGYAGALLGDKNHWVRRLPGKLLQNVISHGVARIAEFLTTDSPKVIAWSGVSPELQRRGETEIIDELRVIISEETGTTAYFTFSSQVRPSLHSFHIYGNKRGLLLDHDQSTLVELRGPRFKSYAEKFLPSLIFARQYLQNFLRNLKLFLNCDFHMKSGMKYLIESFYRSIEIGTSDPIPHREILLTAQIMDRIFEQLGSEQATTKPKFETETMTRK